MISVFWTCTFCGQETENPCHKESDTGDCLNYPPALVRPGEIQSAPDHQDDDRDRH